LRGLLARSSRTVLLPAFTYSLARAQVFDVAAPPANMGALSEHALGTFLRSCDPMFSLLGCGPRAEEILSDLPPTSFGHGSSFNRLHQERTYVVSINLDAGATLLHEIEFQLGVSYRFEKQFSGWIRDGERTFPTSWTTYVRDLDEPASEADFRRLTRDLLDSGLWRRERVGSGFIASISLSVYREFIARKLEVEPKYLTRAGFEIQP
jgi:aminoglycoside 3-N-acetyltransferase